MFVNCAVYNNEKLEKSVRMPAMLMNLLSGMCALRSSLTKGLRSVSGLSVFLSQFLFEMYLPGVKA